MADATTGPEYNVWTDDDNVDEWYDDRKVAERVYAVHRASLPAGYTISLTEYPHHKPNGDLDTHTYTVLLAWTNPARHPEP